MDEKMVSLRINDIPVTVPEGSTVLEAARSAGFNIPSLCFLKDINEIGACRICVVEVKGAKSLVASCVYPVAEGMEVYTTTERVRKSRQLTLELILSNHRMDCLTCSRNSHCELLQLAGDLGIDAVRYANDNMPPQIEASAPHLCGTTPSASSAAGAPPCAARPRRWGSSAPTTGASTPTSAAPSTGIWPRWTASPAASASWPAPPAPSPRRTTPPACWPP